MDCAPRSRVNTYKVDEKCCKLGTEKSILIPYQQKEMFDSIYLLEKVCVLFVFAQNPLLLELRTEAVCTDSPRHQLEGNTANYRPETSTCSADATRMVHFHVHCKDTDMLIAFISMKCATNNPPLSFKDIMSLHKTTHTLKTTLLAQWKSGYSNYDRTCFKIKQA